MAKIFDWDARNGSYVDNISKNLGSITNGQFVTTNKGSALLCQGATQLYFTNTQSLYCFSFSVYINKPVDITVLNCIGSLEDTLGILSLGSTAGALANETLSLWNSNSAYVTYIRDYISLGWHNFIFNWNGLSYDVWMDGQKRTTYAVSGNHATLCNSNISLGKRYSGSQYFTGKVLQFKAWDSALSNAELLKVYNEFANSYTTKEVNRPFYGDKRVSDLSGSVRTTLGPNLVINGTFDSAASWTINGTSEINNGSARIYTPDGTYTAISQTSVLTVGNYYRLFYEVVESISGVLRFSDSVVNYVVDSTVGEHYIDFIAQGTNIVFARSLVVATDIRIDNVEVKEKLGLVLAYNMKPVNGIMPDISGNGWDGTITALTESPNGVICNNKNTSVNVGTINIGNPTRYYTWSVALRCKFIYYNWVKTVFGDSVNESIYINSDIFNFRDISTTFYSFNYTVDYGITTNFVFTSDGTDISLYVNGLYISKITPSSTSIKFTRLITTDLSNKRSTPGEFIDFRCYDRVLELDEIRAYNDMWESRISYTDNFIDDVVGGAILGWKVGSGSFKAAETAIDTMVDVPVPNGGATGTTDWASTITAGLGDDWINLTTIPGFAIFTIITQPGFNGNLQAIARNVTPGDLAIRSDIDLAAPTTGNLYVRTTVFGSRVIDVILIMDDDSEEQIGTMTAASGTAALLMFPYDLPTYTSVKYVKFYCASSPVGGAFYIDEIYIYYEVEIDLPPEVDSSSYISQYKYIECLSSGDISSQLKEAFGSWEFDFYSTSTSFDRYAFIASTKNILTHSGYEFQPRGADGQIRIRLYNSGTGSTYLLQTATGYFDADTWYRVKITRDIKGKFYFYIKGGDFGIQYVLIDVTGGSGANPTTDLTHVTSEYFLMDLDAGDKFRGLKKKGLTTIDPNNTLSGVLNLTL